MGVDGVITTVAGNGTGGFSGDGGQATSARLTTPTRVAITPDGSLVIADAGNNRVRRVSPDGTITTIAGNGTAAFGGDGGLATAASLRLPHAVAVDGEGVLYIADARNNRVRRVGPDGMIRTVAGTGVAGFGGDGGPGTAAQLATPVGLVLGPNGDLYIADLSNDRVRRLSPEGIISTVVEPHPDRVQPIDVALGPDGTLYITGANQPYVEQLRPDGRRLPKAGALWTWEFGGDGGPALRATFYSAIGVAAGPDGSIYIAEASSGTSNGSRIRAIRPMLNGLGVGNVLIASEDGSEIYRFSSAGQHLATLDAFTGTPRLTFEYANGQLVEVTDADGNQTVIERAGDGTPLAIVAPFGQRTQLTLGTDGYLAAVANPASESTRFTYHAGGLLASLTDPKGSGQTFLYDARGRLERDNGRAGEIAAIARIETATGYEVTSTTALGRVTRYTAEQLANGSRRRATTDPAGFVSESMTQPDGTVRTTAPDGTTTEVMQGPDPRFGMQAAIMSSFTVTTPEGLTSTAISGRRTVLATAGNPFSIVSQVDTLILNGRQSVSTYTASTRTFSTTSAENRTTAARFDSLGRIVEAAEPGVLAVSSAYDEAGRLASTSQGSLNWTYTYNAAGLLESASDPLSRSSQFVYDAAGRLTTQTFPGGRAVGFTYDDNGNLLSVTPPERPAHQFSYNASGLPESYTPPAVLGAESPTRYSYNLDRQLTRTTRPDGGTLDFTYDQGGRLNVLSFPAGQLTYTYSTTTGNVSSIAALGGPTLSFTYDGSLARSVSWTGGEVSGRLSFVYDNDFRVATDSVNGGHAVSYGYDQDGLLVAAGSLTLTRDAQNGRLTGTTLGDVASTAAYDSLGLASGTVVTAAGTEVFRTSYRRDALGRLVELAEVVAGEAVTWTYGYDAAGRLSEVTRNGSAYASYEYDANGNRNRVVTAAGAVTASYDAQDRLVSQGTITYNYTANGELSEKSVGSSVMRTQYDALRNLRSAVLADGMAIEYVIDPSDRRIGRKVNGALEKGFLYSGALSPVAELDASGNVVTRFIYATRSNVPDYMVKGGVTYRLLTDHLGSVRLVVNAATGAVVQRLDYDPWGKTERNTNPGFQPFGFAGGLHDEATGLTRFGARDYDPDAGRWTAKDPIGFNGGANLYNYVVSNPVNLVDPSGLCPCRSPLDPSVSRKRTGAGEYGAPRPWSNKRHAGEDILAPQGTPVFSPVNGRIVFLRDDAPDFSAGNRSQAMGNNVLVEFRDGTGNIRYWRGGHMSSDMVVKRTERVAAGQLLGYVGASGNAWVAGPQRAPLPMLHSEWRTSPGAGDEGSLSPGLFAPGSRNCQ